MARRRTVYQHLIPEPITRILALHGPVHVASGLGPGRVSASVLLAPFDDLLVLFLPRRSPLLVALDRDPRAELAIQGGETNYVVRIQGRAVHTGIAAGHERRHELVHWLPEGGTLQGFAAVELVPERIEYAYDEGEERRYFQGVTAANEVPSWVTRWLRLSFEGLIPAVVLGFVGLFVGVGYYGQWYPLKLVALATSVVASFGLLAAARIGYRLLAHRAWQRGRAARHFGGMFSEGLVAANAGWRTAVVLAVMAAIAVVLSGVCWGPELLGLALAASQLWFLLPLWVFRFLGDMGTKPAA